VLGVARASDQQENPFDREVAVRVERFRKEGARPQAVVPLLGVLDLWELTSASGRTAIAAFLDEAAASPTAHPLVRARAAATRALLLDRLGRRDEAAAVRRGLGLVTSVLYVGPFDNEGRAGHAAVFEPERELRAAISLDKKYEGKERPVSWRPLPEVAVAGMLPFEAAVRPETNATVFAAFAVKVAAAQPAALRVGSSGAVKAWVNGREVLARDVYRPARFDQDAGAVALEAGWNRVVVKISGGDGNAAGLGLFVRLTKPDGASLDGAVVSARLEDLNAATVAAGAKGRATAAKGVAVADLGRALMEAAAPKSKPTPQALTDLGLYEFHVVVSDPDKRRAAELLEEAAKRAPTPGAYLRWAAAESDPNDQRRAIELGLRIAEAAPSKSQREVAPLYTRLGEIYARARRERRAEELWLKARAADPRDYLAELELADLAADRGLPALAARRLDELRARLGAADAASTALPIKILRAEAQLAVRRGLRAEADRLWAAIAEAERTDSDAWHELFSAARARGAVDKALAALDVLGRARPDLVALAVDRAEVLDGAGRTAEAHEVLDAALKVAPEDAKILEKDGRLLHRLGRTGEALERMRRALALRPQNPELRAYVAELEERQARAAGAQGRAGRRDDLAARWAEDGKAVIARAGAMPAGDGPARPTAEVLLDTTVTRVHQNGLSETFQQRLVRVLDERGARAESDADVRFTPETQSVDLRAARVYRKSGEVVEAISTDEQDMSEPWYSLYYDVKALVVHFGKLEPGDVVELQYIVSDVARRNMFADYFGDLHYLQEELPRRETKYVLIAPKGKALHFNTPRLPGLLRSEEDAPGGEERIYTFAAKDVPKVDVEPAMPGFTEAAAYLHVSTYKTWEEVARWYEGLVKAQLEPNAAIQAAVREALKGVNPKDERAKIRAIYELVVRRTRYVGLEFGIHGYKPYRVAQVFARKFGDCKDKASLLVVMLREAGIDATMVLARTRRGGDLDGAPASLAPFDHAIAYIPKYDLYLDGTAEFSGADELPADDQDIPVLQVAARKLARTPVLPAARNRLRSEWRVVLQPTGAAIVDEAMSVAGEAAHDWRKYFQAPGERQEKYDQQWNKRHPGARVEKLQMDAEELGRPVEVRALVTVPHWARPDGEGGLAMAALGREPDLTGSYAKLSSRKYDLVLGFPFRTEERVVVRIPDGWTVKRLPEARSVKTPFAQFELKVQQSKDGLIAVEGALQVDRHRIAVADYAAFRAFCGEVDAIVGQELVIAPRAATATAKAAAAGGAR
jgi:transglutaminase-like putative cysteine protease/predicted Zn-dependent protease